MSSTTHKFIIAITLWSVLVAASLSYHFYSLWQATLQSAETAASATLNKDLSYRNWANSHGGVYVPPTERTPANPYLNVPERDVITQSGKILTLLNPAYMIREIQLYYGDQYGSKTVITSLNPINPYNIPDEWEQKALESFEIKVEKYQSLDKINNEPYLKMMVPFIVDENCMKCHAQQGYKVGDIRGGIATYLPMKSFLERQSKRRIELSLTHLIVWLMGLFGFILTWRHQKKLDDAGERIQRLALYDSLTHLPNRHLVNQSLDAPHSPRTGLVLIDIDNFKLLNDTLGHHFGDKLLYAVARRLETHYGSKHFVGRLGGDEFVILLDQLKNNVGMTEQSLISFTQSLLEKMSKPYLIDERDYQVTFSAGCALLDTKSKNPSPLLKYAEVAMYQAKYSGRNTYKLFHQDMLALVSARTWLEKDLRTAVLEQHFELYYQAQVDSNGYILGTEALIRWHHPKRGLLNPVTFLPTAEETGLILPIGQWVLTRACQTLHEWQTDSRFSHLTLAVNVSAHQFYQADFIEQVLIAIQTTGAPANRLKLELTESLFVADIEQVMQKMSELKSLGIQFSLDDFGTGYSSLNYLKRLPLNQLKIDQSFVKDITRNHNDVSIAKMIITLAKELELNVIAEGVEQIEQQQILAQLGCYCYQGYLYGRPQPQIEFEKTLPRL